MSKKQENRIEKVFVESGNDKQERDILLWLSTIDIQLMSLHASIKDVISIVDNRANIISYEKWREECEQIAKDLIKGVVENGK